MNNNIESLVEEALKKLAGSNLGETYTTNILTTLAEEASKNVECNRSSGIEAQMFNLLLHRHWRKTRVTGWCGLVAQTLNYARNQF